MNQSKAKTQSKGNHTGEASQATVQHSVDTYLWHSLEKVSSSQPKRAESADVFSDRYEPQKSKFIEYDGSNK